MNRADLSVGERVEFGTNKIRVGTVVKLNPKKAVVDVDNDGGWRVPYSNLRLNGSKNGVETAPIVPTAPYIPATNSDLTVGDRVVFGRRNGRKHLGKVLALNAMSVRVVSDEGRRFRADYSLVNKA